MASRFSLVAADLLVLCITWYRTHETVKMSRHIAPDRTRPSFASTLLRDGTTYFLRVTRNEFLTLAHLAYS
ncbi:hypothetical protein BD310DRAFT_939446 [Dichomitus squalens]|uniref:Secreted protein n=1 Tax=Dichomitus squalens TaxID=114155 RepID=A0A4V2K6L9_9APHY|nr:hypothetical protein BD310DRAFT_939446 [Dichomitus squalens]